MSKCLVTKLNGVAENKELITLDEFFIKFEVKKPARIAVTKGKYKVDDVAYNGTDLIPVGKHLLKVSPKQTFEQLSSISDNLVMDLDSIRGTGYMPNFKTIWQMDTTDYSRKNSFKGDLSSLSPFNMVEIHLYGCSDITGSLRDIKKFKDIEKLELYGTKVDCYDLSPILDKTKLSVLSLAIHSKPLNIEPLAVLTNLVDLRCLYGDYKGSVENLAQGMVNNGRKSGTLKLYASYSSITYNGEQTNKEKTYIITFNENGYTVS